MNGDLKKAADATGLKVVASPEFTRTGNIEGLGSPTGIPEIFTKPVGSVFGPSFMGTSRVFGRITSRTPANPAELAAQMDSLRDDIKRTKARERNALFEDGIRQKLTKEGKIKIYNDVLKRITAG
jgi:peptidyl-prolyl cis-trans isomerase D